MARRHDYVDVPLVAFRDFDSGRLVIAALLDGVEVPIAAPKIGHYEHLLVEARDEREAAEAKQAADDALAAARAGAPAPVAAPAPDPASGQPEADTSS